VARIWSNFAEGTPSVALSNSDTTLQAAFLANVPVVTGPDIMVLVLDPEAEENGPEVVHVTAHSASSTSATILRAQEGTTAVSHSTSVKVSHTITEAVVEDWESDIATLQSDLDTHEGGTATADHPEATPSVRGFMSAADKTKLDSIESAATADQTPAEILAGLLTVDGSGSGLDADLLDGQQASEFADSGHTHGDFLERDGSNTMTGNLDPDSDNARDLGDSALTWRRAYLYELWSPAGNEVVDVQNQKLLNGDWDVDGNMLPNDDETHDLGSSSFAWRRLYAQALYDETGQAVLDLSGPTFTPRTTFNDGIDIGASGTIRKDGDTDTYLDFATSANQLRAFAGGDMIWIIGTSGFHTNFNHDLGDTSGLFIGEAFADVGNHETLRGDRNAAGTGTTEVGYFSSWEFDPHTGERRKTDIQSLIDSPRFPGLGIIDELRMIDFQRISTGQREWGVNLNDLQASNEDWRYLTTKGDSWGYSPDEMAFIAVLWEAVADLRARVA